jgi:hypothetical protein
MVMAVNAGRWLVLAVVLATSLIGGKPSDAFQIGQFCLFFFVFFCYLVGWWAYIFWLALPPVCCWDMLL